MFTYAHKFCSRVRGILKPDDPEVNFIQERSAKVDGRKKEDKSGWDQHDFVDLCPHLPTGIGVYEPSETMNQACQVAAVK